MSFQPGARAIVLLSSCMSLSCAQGDGQDAPVCSVTSVPTELEATTYYKKYCDAQGGLPILASDAVSDDALTAAAALVARVLGERPLLRDGIAAAGGRVVLLGEHERLLDLPEADRNIEDRDFYRHVRGVTFTANVPPIAVAPEENVLCWATGGGNADRNTTLLHELGHLIHLVGLQDVRREGARLTFAEEVEQAYDNAIQNELWADTYAATDPAEYWAEGVVLYFAAPERASAANMKSGIADRDALSKHDPALFDLLRWAFGDDDWYPACPKQKPAALAGRACKEPYAGRDVTSFSLFHFAGTSVSGTAQLPRALEGAAEVRVRLSGVADQGGALSAFSTSARRLPAGTTEFRYTIENIPPGEYLLQVAVDPDDLGFESYWVGTYNGRGEGSHSDLARIGATPRCEVDVTLYTPEER
jgi:alpha-glucosidase